MTKQKYEKPNMVIVVLNDVITSSTGCYEDLHYGCDPDYSCSDVICASDGGSCPGYAAPCYGLINNGTIIHDTICVAVGG